MERAMEEAKSLAQQQQLMLQHHLDQQQQHHLQRHQHQQMLFLQHQIQQQQHFQQQQAAAFSRFPANHPGSSFRSPLQPQSQQIPLINPNPSSNPLLISNLPQNPNPNLIPNSPPPAAASSAVPKVNRNTAEIQMAYQDLWKVCHPDYNTPFSSLEDACERFLFLGLVTIDFLECICIVYRADNLK